MELSDLMMDIEGTKMASMGFCGAIIGCIAGAVNFDDKVINHNKKLIFNDSYKDLELTKTIIALATGVPNVDYGDSFMTDSFETLAYVSSARVGYEIGNQIVKRAKSYIKGE
jgi:hypothetical protein